MQVQIQACSAFSLGPVGSTVTGAVSATLGTLPRPEVPGTQDRALRRQETRLCPKAGRWSVTGHLRCEAGREAPPRRARAGAWGERAAGGNTGGRAGGSELGP